MKYFSNLKNGWADLTIGDFYCPCSYIQNVPMVILCAYKEFEENGYCIINLDSEGYEHEIIITDLGVYVFTYCDKIIHYNLTEKFNTHVKKLTLLKDLVEDVIDNVDEWSKWLCLVNPNEKHYKKTIEEYKNNLLRYAEKYNILSRNN